MKRTWEAGQWISYILCSALVITSAIFFGHLASKVWKPSAVPVNSVENAADRTSAVSQNGCKDSIKGISADCKNKIKNLSQHSSKYCERFYSVIY